jgi:hypothetical protein
MQPIKSPAPQTEKPVATTPALQKTLDKPPASAPTPSTTVKVSTPAPPAKR